SMASILTYSSEAGQMPGHAIPSAHAHGGAIMAAQGRPIWARRPGTRRSGMRLGRLASLVAFALSVAAVPAAAQTFVFGAQGEPVQLDPAVITDGISSRITRQIYDGLVKYKGATTDVEPALAQSWEVSADAKVWTFTLRRNVKFHDGTPLDAKAVVWNF